MRQNGEYRTQNRDNCTWAGLYFEVHGGTGAIGVAWVARTNIGQKLDVARPPDAHMRLDGYIDVLVEAEREA